MMIGSALLMVFIIRREILSASFFLYASKKDYPPLAREVFRRPPSARAGERETWLNAFGSCLGRI